MFESFHLSLGAFLPLVMGLQIKRRLWDATQRHRDAASAFRCHYSDIRKAGCLLGETPLPGDLLCLQLRLQLTAPLT